ncbi:MAG: ribonuclease III [Chitinophagales bacterium]|nr:ribonuclease III [Chitinophagaceae bacterium]MCB9065504.1 ribonuclease III [Chitinophagales bacterium]
MLHLFSPNKELVSQLEHLLGFTPKHIPYYQLALMHRSKIEEIAQNNERLEFLGDAILGSIIADYLFKKYPYETEGYLTEMRSRIVRRETLNNIALRMGLQKLVQYNQNDKGLSRSHIFGNALEAMIGAVYLDQGFHKTKSYILKQIVKPYIDIEALENSDTNYKNQFLSWAQKNNHEVSFDTVDEKTEGTRKVFTIAISLNGDIVSEGSGFNKKEAGQVAAQAAIDKLSISNGKNSQ